MPVATRNQLTFGGGISASIPSHLIGQDQVQTATNLDFSIERGAARSRRGYTSYLANGFANYAIYKSYGPNSVTEASLYTAHISANGTGTSGVGRAGITGGVLGTYTSITPTTDELSHFVKYRNRTYIAGGYILRKDDGTNTTEWVKQVPDAPAVTINTNAGISIITAGASLTTLEGTSSLASGTSTTTGDATTGRTTLVNVAAFNLGTNGSFATGTAGIIYAKIGFSDPQNVYRISLDFATDSVTVTGTKITAGFQNYWHGEYLPNIGRSITAAYPSADVLTGAANQQGTNALTPDQVSSIQSLINANSQTPQTNIAFSAQTISALAIPKTSFQFVGTWPSGTGDPWQGITAVRITVESYVTAQTTYLTDIKEIGDIGHCLTDINVGYTWYQTFAEIDSAGNFLGESAASAPAGPYRCINANATVVNTSTITGSISGITHVITYRQGGYAQTPFAVSTKALATATITDTMADIQALLLDSPMAINVASPAAMGYWNIVSSDHFYERIFLANTNTLRWSEAGRPDQFLILNTALISDDSDPIRGLVVWPPGLVIVNWKSVYELTGSIFDGPNSDFVIQRAAARRGSIAPDCCIKTPHGIPLLNYDGLTMYQPGAGVDQPLPWVTEQIGDAFRGVGTADPAGLNGGRIPAVNGLLYKAAAAYSEGKLYISAATGTNTINDTVFVMDFTTQKCWWYQYKNVGFGTNTSTPQAMTSLYWDFTNNQMYGAGIGGVFNIESGVTEIAGTTTSPVPWNFKTRTWTVPNDTLVENLAVEYVGGPFEVAAIYEGTATYTLGTCTSSNRTYTFFPLNGVVENNLVFRFQEITGTNLNAHTAVYGLAWDSIAQPQRGYFYQTEYNDNNYPGDKLWDVLFCDLDLLQAPTSGSNGTSTVTATGTVVAVTFVDGVAIMTNTITGTGTPSAGRRIYSFSFPAETYGEVAYTTYTGVTTTATGTVTNTTSSLFKLWDHRFAARNEPARTTVWRTTIESLDEAICDAFDVDINPNGTVLATAFVDNTALMTATITGSQRQSYTYKLPVEIYGRTIYVLYNIGSNTSYFKHYTTTFHRRPEPDRWTNYVSDRRSQQERIFDAFECEINPLGNTVVSTAFIDGTAVSTFTYTGSKRERYVNAFLGDLYGKTVWAQYSVSAGTDTALNPSGGRFKFFSDNFIGQTEPDRLNFVQKILPPWPTDQYVKTWLAELNPLGTCTGTFIVDGLTITTATFTGTIRESYVVGMDAPSTIALQTATAVEIRYAGNLFKHYQTSVETDPKPFGKTTWAVSYKKTGGASQIDMARFWAADVEIPTGTTVFMTSIWDIDGLPGFSTNTLTLTQARSYIDRIPFPPGGRGRLFQQRIQFSSPAKVWNTSIDEEHIGIKGLARNTLEGTPAEHPYSKYKYSS